MSCNLSYVWCKSCRRRINPMAEKYDEYLSDWRNIFGLRIAKLSQKGSTDRHIQLQFLTAVPCDVFPKPENAKMVEMGTFFDQVTAFKCEEGYMFSIGSVWKFVACRQNYVNDLIGRWNETKLPDCKCRKEWFILVKLAGVAGAVGQLENGVAAAHCQSNWSRRTQQKQEFLFLGRTVWEVARTFIQSEKGYGQFAFISIGYD